MSARYQSGFGNFFESEAEAGCLPQGQNSPQKHKKGLYAELLSGSAFTQPRETNKQAWLYKIKPSVSHGAFTEYNSHQLQSPPFDQQKTSPEQYRWLPLPKPKTPLHFVDSMVSMAGCGSLGESGIAIHHFYATQNMGNSYFFNSDAEMLLVPELHPIHLFTEMGVLELEPQEIAVVPRGIKFKVDLPKGEARGYVLENYGSPFRLPDLGPIGANGLANPRDFLYPSAHYERDLGPCQLIHKFHGNLWAASLNDSPLDVVAWHGNYAPYKYDLRRFNTMNTVSYDHADPSIFTVLTSPGTTPGKANVDFVIFPPRWMVAEASFRPPYYHRNLMSEYMGLIHGVYDAKEEGFIPGGASLHNCFAAHGPEASVYEKASQAELKPEYLADTMAFMFETSKIIHPTNYALNCTHRDTDYLKCWQGIKVQF